MARKKARAVTGVIAFALTIAFLDPLRPLADASLSMTPIGPGVCSRQAPTSRCVLPMNRARVVSFVQTSFVVGNVPANIMLMWDPPDEGDPTSYVLEAGTAPGLSNIAVFDTGAADTTQFVVGVPAGIYYVRVKARNAVGVIEPSNEITITVGGTAVAAESSCPAPLPPTGLSSTVSGSTVTLSWMEAPGATSYQIEAGSAPGASDVFSGEVGDLRTLQANVTPGTYFVRVRGKSRCGISPRTDEIAITIGAPDR